MTSDAGVFSRSIRVEDIPEGQETPFAFEADPEERAGLARQLGVPAVAGFAAEFRLFRRPGDRLRVEGAVRARVTQVCVVSLEPFETDVEEQAAVEFAPPAVAEAAAARAAREPPPGQTLADLPDPPDPIVDGRVDLGAVAVEFLALALDPYPRKPGVAFEPPRVESDPEASPFSALGSLEFGDD